MLHAGKGRSSRMLQSMYAKPCGFEHKAIERLSELASNHSAYNSPRLL